MKRTNYYKTSDKQERKWERKLSNSSTKGDYYTLTPKYRDKPNLEDNLQNFYHILNFCPNESEVCQYVRNINVSITIPLLSSWNMQRLAPYLAGIGTFFLTDSFWAGTTVKALTKNLLGSITASTSKIANDYFMNSHVYLVKCPAGFSKHLKIKIRQSEYGFGYPPTDSFVYQHPEWVLDHKDISIPFARAERTTLGYESPVLLRPGDKLSVVTFFAVKWTSKVWLVEFPLCCHFDYEYCVA